MRVSIPQGHKICPASSKNRSGECPLPYIIKGSPWENRREIAIPFFQFPKHRISSQFPRGCYYKRVLPLEKERREWNILGIYLSWKS